MLIGDSERGQLLVRTPLLVLSFIALLAATGAATPIILEAENYVGAYNVGGEPIHVVYCSSASGGMAVEGYDTVGDFIELRIILDMAGAYDDTLCSAGELYQFSQHRVTYRREYGGILAYSDFMTYGYGIG
jgi:hypothetical protein